MLMWVDPVCVIAFFWAMLISVWFQKVPWLQTTGRTPAAPKAAGRLVEAEVVDGGRYDSLKPFMLDVYRSY